MSVMKGGSSRVSINQILEMLEYLVASDECDDHEYGLYLESVYKGDKALKNNTYKCRLMSWYAGQLGEEE